jgi:hypothetical protein
MLSNYRIGLGGEARVKAWTSGQWCPERRSRLAFPHAILSARHQLRTNMTTSAWIDLANTIAAKDRAVIDDNGAEIPGREVLRFLDGLRDDPKNAAYRWVVAVGEDNLMKLQLQSLPGPAVLNSGKPTLRQ